MRKIGALRQINGNCRCMAEAVQSAVYCWGETVESFFDKFIRSGVCLDFEACKGFVTVGCRGEELVTRVYYELEHKETGIFGQLKKARMSEVHHTREYWTGFMIAYMQYMSDVGFEEMFMLIPPEEWYSMYPMYHEMGEHVIASQLMPRITGGEFKVPRWKENEV